MRSKSRRYFVHWNWRDDKDGSPVKRDEIQATTALGAAARFKKSLAEEYSEVNDSTLIIHEIVLAY